MRILGFKRRLRPARGFSLIEITIAVAILAALMGLAVMQLAPATDRMRLRAEVREIVGLMGDARTRAITTRQVGVIELDAKAARIFYGDPVMVRQLPPQMALRIAAGDDDAGGRERQRIVFYPEGSASGAAFAIADRNRAIGVRVDWLTGRISIDEGRGNAG